MPVDPSLCITIAFPSGETFTIQPFTILEINYRPYFKLDKSLQKYKYHFIKIYSAYFFNFYKDKLLTLDQVKEKLNFAAKIFIRSMGNFDYLDIRPPHLEAVFIFSLSIFSFSNAITVNQSGNSINSW